MCFIRSIRKTDFLKLFVIVNFCAIENLQVKIRVKKNVKKVRGMSEVAFGLGQEILQRPLRI